MKSIYLFLLTLIFAFKHSSGQQIGHLTTSIIDSSRNNRSISLEVYYPSITAGNNTPISSGSFPLISFGHGFVMSWSAYQNIWEALVPEGYIIVFPTTEIGFSPNHSDFGKDLKFIITHLQSNGAGSIINSSNINNKSAIMGHSMGGGSAFLAAENNSNITTMVSFAAANTNPSSINAAKNISIPTLIMSGSNDCVAPPQQHQDFMYDSSSSTYKTQVYIKGGSHCFFANSNVNCSFGESTCSPSPTITRLEQQKTTNDFIKLWLSYYLKGNCLDAEAFQDSLNQSTRITFRQNQSISCATGLNQIDNEVKKLTAYPNPFKDKIFINYKNSTIVNLKIYNSQLVCVKTINNHESETGLNLSELNNGLYFVLINNQDWVTIFKN